MKKQPAVTENTRQTFINVFCELYQQKPIEKISVQEIANKSGYNRSTFYQYFIDIYELLEYIENDVLEYFQEILETTDRTELKPQDIAHFFDAKRTYLQALLGDYGSLRFLDKLKAKISTVWNSFNFSNDNMLTPYLLEFHVSIVFSMFHLWQRRDQDLALDELYDLIDKLCTTGISSFIK